MPTARPAAPPAAGRSAGRHLKYKQPLIRKDVGAEGSAVAEPRGTFLLALG
jgi:hypothetical protein